ncbi:hypothetical protein H2248_003816 [Termitomyces sp. 'cryptogamus']|nr:hypothetical protein H2248_003816 [Termitomyces sp. 'cryptogamus']
MISNPQSQTRIVLKRRAPHLFSIQPSPRRPLSPTPDRKHPTQMSDIIMTSAPGSIKSNSSQGSTHEPQSKVLIDILQQLTNQATADKTQATADKEFLKEHIEFLKEQIIFLRKQVEQQGIELRELREQLEHARK